MTDLQMLRVNLLPDAHETMRIFGMRIDYDMMRSALGPLALAMLVPFVVFALQRVRLSMLQTQAAHVTLEDRALVPLIGRARQISETIAHLQQVAARAQDVRMSGNTQAVEIALVGERVKSDRHTWLSAVHGTGEGWELVGVSDSVRDLSRAAGAFDRTGTFSLVSAQESSGKMKYDALVSAQVGPP